MATSGLHNSGYWCAGIASEGRQIDIMVWRGSLRERAAGAEAWFADLGVNLSICIGPLWCLRWGHRANGRTGSLAEGPESSPERATNRKRIILVLTVDFYCKQVNAIDFVSAVTSKTLARRSTRVSLLSELHHFVLQSFPPCADACKCKRQCFLTRSKVLSSHNIDFVFLSLSDIF